MSEQARDQELRVICAGGFRAVMEVIAPAYEAREGVTLRVTFGTPARTRELVTAGEGFDLVVVTAGSLDEAAAAQLDSATRFIVAKSPVGMGLRPGLGKKPIGALSEFIAVIDSLSSIGLSDPKAGTNLGADILSNAERLGFVEKLRPKAQFVFGPGSVASGHVAKGEIDAVITLVSEIIAVEGVTFLGAIPAEMGLGTPFVGATARSPDSKAAAFLAYLRTPECQEAMQKTGLIALP